MPDAEAAKELELYIDNDGDLYRRQTLAILKNLATKRARGQYKHDLAVKLFGYLTEAGAKKYVQEYGTPGQPWHKMFDAGTRKLAAEALTRSFETEAKLGNYDHLLPKKYQKKTSGHARKKQLQWRTPESIKVTWSPVKQSYLALYPGHGRIENQQVLKVAGADEMHGWLRDTYGDAYGLAGRSATSGHARKKQLQWRTPESIKVTWSPVKQAYLALYPGHGRIENQQVLKVAGADEMHGWLRGTYGDAYGLVARSSRTKGASRPKPSGHARKKGLSWSSGTHRGSSDVYYVAQDPAPGLKHGSYTMRRREGGIDLIYERWRDSHGGAVPIQHILIGSYPSLSSAKRAASEHHAGLRENAPSGYHGHAIRKSPRQLDSEISQLLGGRRYPQ